jgi:hypothetical protein
MGIRIICSGPLRWVNASVILLALNTASLLRELAVFYSILCGYDVFTEEQNNEG